MDSKTSPLPHVITLHVRRRLPSIMGAVTALAMLPVLAGSAQTPRAEALLAAGASHAVVASADGTPALDRAAGGGLAPGLEAAGTSATVAQAIQALTAGADQILFPGLQLGTAGAVSTLSMAAGRFGLSWPLHGPEASGFGPRIHPVLGRPMFHTGIDLMAACGTPIRAAADGQAVYAAITPSWGRRVILRHSSSLETGYAHMSLFLVGQGDTVKRGQVIGLVGTTGWSTGCHLHFDVIVNGNYVDPAPYLGLPGTSAAEVPYHTTPSVSSGGPGTPARPVEDGDVPVSAAVSARSANGPGTSTTGGLTSSSSTNGPSTTSGPSTTPPATTSPDSTTSTTSTPTTTSTTSTPTTTSTTPTTTTPDTTTTSTTSTPTTTPGSTTTSTSPTITSSTSTSPQAPTVRGVVNADGTGWVRIPDASDGLEVVLANASGKGSLEALNRSWSCTPGAASTLTCTVKADFRLRFVQRGLGGAEPLVVRFPSLPGVSASIPLG